MIHNSLTVKYIDNFKVRVHLLFLHHAQANTNGNQTMRHRKNGFSKHSLFGNPKLEEFNAVSY